MPRSMIPLVGRQAELASALAAVRPSSAARGHGSVLVVDGDAGIGKTRLLIELSAVAQAANTRVLVGHCVDLGDAPPPYLPFTEAFGRLAREDAPTADALVAEHPALSRMLPRGSAAAVPDDRVERGELFNSVLGALSAMGQEQPVLLIIEDVHWADQATRDLLGFLFTRITDEPVAIVVSYRSDDLHRRHPLRTTLAQWSRLPTVQRLHLNPMAGEDVSNLVRAIGGTTLAEETVQNIVSRADGNAFFAEELVTAAEQDCCDTDHLPWALADLMLVRLDRLDDAAREVVRVAAVGGRRVSHDLLEAVVDLTASQLDGALREAVEAHVLEPTSSGRGYTFRHALLTEAVYDDLLPGERVRIHTAYAEVLAKREESSAAELARHALASHDLATAYDASVRAAEEAMAVAAPLQAMQHYETALELARRAPAGDDDPSRLVLACVEAAVAAGHAYRGVKLAGEALASLPAGAAGDARARLLLADALAQVEGEVDDETMALTSEALRLVPAEPPSALRARLAALHAHVVFILGREADAQRWAKEAIDAARAVGCAEAAADAQTTLAMLERHTGDALEAARMLSALAEEAQVSGDVETELRSRYSLASLYYELADFDASLAASEETDRRARAAGRPWAEHGLNARLLAALVHYVTGDWDGALRTVDTGTAAPPRSAAAKLQVTGMRVRACRGDATILDEVAGLRPGWERDGRLGLYSVMAALEVYQQQGRPEEAVALLDELVAVLGPLWQDEWFLGRIELSAKAIAALATAVATASQAQRAELARRGAALVEAGRTSAEKGLPRARSMGREGHAWLDRLEAEWARLRWLAGVDVPDEQEHIAAWRRSVEAFDYGDVYETARSRTRLAAVLRAAGRGAEAAEQAGLARDAARSLGAEPLLEEIRALGLSAAPRKAAAPAGLGALTSRERDVLELIVAGRTNRQIATQLYISEKTVSVHVSNILAKLGVRSRTEAAAAARRGG